MALWTPDVEAPTLWLDPSDAAARTVAGTDVTELTNKGSLSVTVTGAGAALPQLITAGQNGLDVVEFADAGAPRFDLSVHAVPAGDRTVIMVWAATLLGASHSILTNTIAADPLTQIILPSGNGGWDVNDNSGIGRAAFFPTLSEFYVLTHTTDKTTISRYIDGVPYVKGLAYPGNPEAFNRIGGSSGNAFRLAELIIYDKILSTEAHFKLDGYLAEKWGLRAGLTPLHPYKTLTPNVEDILTTTSVPWTPEEYGVYADFDASDTTTITADGAELVQVFANKSPANTVAYQSTASAKPTRLLADQNGLDTLQFNIGDFMPITDDTGTLVIGSQTPQGDRHLVCVWQRNAAGNAAILIQNSSSSNYIYLHYFNSWYVGGSAIQSVPITDGVFHIASHATDRSTVTRYLDGVAQTPAATNTLDVWSSLSSIFSSVALKLGQVIMLAEDSSDITNLQKAEGYARIKWGLTLDPGHPYASATPMLDVYSVFVAPPAPGTNETLARQTQAFADYLPNGHTFEAKNIAGSNFRSLLEGIAYEFARVQNHLARLEEDYYPDQTTEYLGEWERAVQIPDACFLATGALTERRRDVLLKLGINALYGANSLIALAALFGYTVTVDTQSETYLPKDVPFIPGSGINRFTVIVSGTGLIDALPPLDVPFTPGGTFSPFLCWLQKQLPANATLLINEVP